MAVFGTRSAVFKVGGTDYSDSVSKVRIRSGETDADFMSFAEAAAGGARKYMLVFELKQDSAAAALWYYAWSMSGSTVAYTFEPNGTAGASATVAKPRFTGNVVVREPDGDFIGGDADPSTTKVFKAEFEWDCTAKPTLVIS